MTTDPTNPGSQGQVPGGQGTPGQAPTSTPQAGNEPQPQLSHEDALRLLAETRSEAAANRVELNKLKAAQKKQDEAAQALEQARLAEQGQFKELAAKHETRVKELEPLAERLAKLSELEHNRIDAMVKDWPEELKKLVPSRDLDAEVRLAQVENLQPLLAKLQQQAQGQFPGNRPNPPAASPSAAKQAAIEKDRQVYGRALRGMF